MTTRLSPAGGAVIVTLGAASGLLVALHAPAGARESHFKPRHPIIRPSADVTQSYIAPGGVRIYRDDSVPGGFRTDHDPPPSPNDPSRWGGGAP
jgi:hypothetical protein